MPTANAEIQLSRYRREIIINVDKVGDIFINSIRMSPERLAEILKAVRADSANQPVVIRADQDARHKDVIRVLDLCSELGLNSRQLVDKVVPFVPDPPPQRARR